MFPKLKFTLLAGLGALMLCALPGPTPVKAIEGRMMTPYGMGEYKIERRYGFRRDRYWDNYWRWYVRGYGPLVHRTERYPYADLGVRRFPREDPDYHEAGRVGRIDHIDRTRPPVYYYPATDPDRLPSWR